MTAVFTKDVTFYVQIDCAIKATSDVVNFDSNSRRFQKVTFSGEKLEYSLLHLSEAVGYFLTMEQMLQVIFSNVDLIRDFDGVSQPDTSTKDMFANAFGKFILKNDLDDRHWPVGGDSKEYTEKFFNDLNETADGLGYVRLPH